MFFKSSIVSVLEMWCLAFSDLLATHSSLVDLAHLWIVRAFRGHLSYDTCASAQRLKAAYAGQG